MLRLIESFGVDLAPAVRQLGRAPGLTALAVAVLALGLGAVTTVFALINALLFQPLPVAEPERLVMLSNPSFSYPQFRELQRRGTMFDGVFAYERRRLNVRWHQRGAIETAEALLATGDFQATLGVRPALGRTLVPSDGGTSAAEAKAVAVLSHSAWRRRFGGDSAVIGRTIHIENTPVTVVGVAPRGFFGMAVGTAPEITIPLTLYPALRRDSRNILTEPARAWVHIAGRLRAGITLAQANAAFQVIWPEVLRATVSADQTAERRTRYLSRRSELVPGALGFSSVRNQYRQPLWLLFGLVGVLLLATCATVANLTLVRTASRRRELAIRLAIGAGRARIFGQLLTEGVLLAALGALLGAVLAAWATELLITLLSTREEPILLARVMELRVFAFVAFAAIATAVLFTFIPALKTTRLDPGATLREAARHIGGHSARTGKALVAGQIALAMLLVAGAALFTRSLAHLLTLDAGFDKRNVAVIGLDALSSPTVAGDDGAADRVRLISFYAQALEQAGTLPGVQTAALAWMPPISGDDGWWTRSIGIDGTEPVREDETPTFFNAISPDYFATSGTSLLLGRDFRWSDRDGAPRVVIINESLARAFFGTSNPIGRRISIGLDESRQDVEIVGVAHDAKYQRLQESSRRIAYLPYPQLHEFLEGSNLSLIVRTELPVRELADPMRRTLAAIDPLVPVHVESLHDRIRNTLTIERSLAAIAGFLGGFALLIAFGALYGLMAHLVGQRRHEIGVRMALGAPHATVLRMVVRESLALAAAGVAIGLVLAYNGMRVVSGFVHGISPADPWAISAAVALMAALAAVAAYVPARNATHVDPAVALRSE